MKTHLCTLKFRDGWEDLMVLRVKFGFVSKKLEQDKICCTRLADNYWNTTPFHVQIGVLTNRKRTVSLSLVTIRNGDKSHKNKGRLFKINLSVAFWHWYNFLVQVLDYYPRGSSEWSLKLWQRHLLDFAYSSVSKF